MKVFKTGSISSQKCLNADVSMESKRFYEFGPFRIDLEERQLLRGEEPVPLAPKAFETLLILVRSSERVVLKDDLMKTLWPDSFVEESNLFQSIFLLRKALRGRPRMPATSPRFQVGVTDFPRNCDRSPKQKLSGLSRVTPSKR
jgi:hypothetical protein